MNATSELSWRRQTIIAWAVVLLCMTGDGFGIAQESTAEKASICSARQIELFGEGGDGATGHFIQTFGLRNVSAMRCSLFGVPQLEFLDKGGRRLTIPYGKNVSDFMFPKQPEKRVDLAPGDFAHFMIGTTVADQHLRFEGIRVLLPADDTPIVVDVTRSWELESINISSVVTGFGGSDEVSVPPTRYIRAISETHPDLSLTLEVPPRPEQYFDAHLALRNSGTGPLDLNWKQCALHESLTSSTGKRITATQNCEVWRGALGPRGTLEPGGRVTTDFIVGGDEVAQKICSTGNWNSELSLETPLGTVRFAPFFFSVSSTMCSDSKAAGKVDVDDKTIHSRS